MSALIIVVPFDTTLVAARVVVPRASPQIADEKIRLFSPISAHVPLPAALDVTNLKTLCLLFHRFAASLAVSLHVLVLPGRLPAGPPDGNPPVKKVVEASGHVWPRASLCAL